MGVRRLCEQQAGASDDRPTQQSGQARIRKRQDGRCPLDGGVGISITETPSSSARSPSSMTVRPRPVLHTSRQASFPGFLVTSAVTFMARLWCCSRPEPFHSCYLWPVRHWHSSCLFRGRSRMALGEVAGAGVELPDTRAKGPDGRESGA